jgi:hypothetical protein
MQNEKETRVSVKKENEKRKSGNLLDRTNCKELENKMSPAQGNVKSRLNLFLQCKMYVIQN